MHIDLPPVRTSELHDKLAPRAIAFNHGMGARHVTEVESLSTQRLDPTVGDSLGHPFERRIRER